MKVLLARIIIVMLLMTAGASARAQSPIATITLGPDQIGLVKTGQGITTRISFPQKVNEIICGDLYDPGSGKGTFVVQSSGNDVFLKPIAAKGMSNLFVKTGDDGKLTYNFDLTIVPVAQAHRVVNVAEGQPGAQQVETPADPGAQNGVQPAGTDSGRDSAVNARDLERRKADMLSEARKDADEILRKARKDADEILRKSRQQAGRIVEEADQRADQRINDVDRQMTQRATQEAGRRFVQSLVLGLREVRINNPRVSVKKVTVTLDPRVLLFDEKSYLRYVIQNMSDGEFAYGSISLEAGQANNLVPIEVVQTKNENKLAPGESLTGIVIFDAKLVGTKERLTLYVRGEDKAEIARVSIQ